MKAPEGRPRPFVCPLQCCTDLLVSSCADGLFGQCQAPHQEPVQYQVSVPVLHKLQEVLKDLMVQGEPLSQ